MKINFTRKFVKHYEKANRKIKEAFKKRLTVFKINPTHIQLNNHTLTGKYSKHRSINITGDWRAIFSIEKVSSDIIVTFEMLGTHSQLYK